MGLVHCWLLVLMSAQLVLTFPPTDFTQYYSGRECKLCPAGQYRKSCAECEPCPAGRYTAEENGADRCRRCSGDCRPIYHLKVVQNCTSTANVRCVCEAGFRCTDWVPYSTNCRLCEKIQETTTTGAAAVISGKDKHTASSASPGQSSASTKRCQFPKCDSKSDPVAGNDTHLKAGVASVQLVAILCPLVIVLVALVILFFLRRPRGESCFKQAITMLPCNEGSRNASRKSKESAHQFPRDSFSAKQQPAASLSAANMGPVHVHNPGTVIFSLLSQFTGQVGPNSECGKTAERGKGAEEDDSSRPVVHPTSSPSIHLSEEERSGEIDCIFFPSQEEGKDCHVSKEEAL